MLQVTCRNKEILWPLDVQQQLVFQEGAGLDGYKKWGDCMERANCSALVMSVLEVGHWPLHFHQSCKLRPEHFHKDVQTTHATKHLHLRKIQLCRRARCAGAQTGPEPAQGCTHPAPGAVLCVAQGRCHWGWAGVGPGMCTASGWGVAATVGCNGALPVISWWGRGPVLMAKLQ